VKRLADRLNIEMPITNAVSEVLYNGKPPHDAVSELMTRPLREEVNVRQL
jgi:glycerol-3-phosphate dehydrogenase (NAD(P)+)